MHPIQARIRAEARRFNVVALGRRTGKTTLAQDLIVETVLDDRAPCAYFAPTYKNLAETWRDLVGVLRPIARRVSETDHRIEVLGSKDSLAVGVDARTPLTSLEPGGPVVAADAYPGFNWFVLC